MARGLKFRIQKVEGLYYPCSENKGADLHLCFRIFKNPVFSRRGSNNGDTLIWKIEMYSNDPKLAERYVLANSADPDQTAPLG